VKKKISKQTQEQCVEMICQFAQQYRIEKQLAPRQLFEKTDYDSHFQKITQKEIEKTIEQNNSLINDWIFFTEDKRWTPAWGLADMKNGSWMVFHVLKGGIQDYEIFLITLFRHVR
jgi:hypothetical protein